MDKNRFIISHAMSCHGLQLPNSCTLQQAFFLGVSEYFRGVRTAIIYRLALWSYFQWIAIDLRCRHIILTWYGVVTWLHFLSKPLLRVFVKCLSSGSTRIFWIIKESRIMTLWLMSLFCDLVSISKTNTHFFALFNPFLPRLS